jgi:hypothetical protein
MPPQRRNQNTHNQQKAYKVALPQAKAGQGSLVGAGTTVRGSCYNCGQMGHFSKACPFPAKKKQTTYPARVHHTTVDEIPEGEPMTASMFPINQYPAVILFDSGSSHSFMSQAFARKHDQ